MRRFLFNKVFYIIFILLPFFIFANEIQAGIVLKVLATNPSEQYSRDVPVKVYLPKEAKPDHIIDKGDLEVGYDAQQGSYYVYGIYKLKPLEVVEREIELEDIWLVDEVELESLGSEVEKIQGLLKNTEFTERVNFLSNSIESKIDEITERQNSATANPEEHISEYRYNLQLLKSAKSDLAIARSMLGKKKRFSAKMVWKLMLYIVIFLGALSLSFYFIWHRHVKLLVGEREIDKPKKEDLEKEPSGETAKPRQTTSSEDDIEKILRGE